MSTGAVHPHACGERGTVPVSGVLLFGSSPRLWGTLAPRLPASRPRRFIPTPVGNAATSAALPGHLPVHPHACGERRPRMTSPGCIGGSSPRLWGTLSRRLNLVNHSRFIPTPVGNAACRSRPIEQPAVHPHACGERTNFLPDAFLSHGSSHACGNALLRDAGLSPNPVHPHACGERFSASKREVCAAGSSPRLWGTLHTAEHRVFQRRFIPTPVGNAPRRRWLQRLNPVHPHACGERTFCPVFPPISTGSSPRLWGTHQRRAAWAFAIRFIPTPVGNACRLFVAQNVPPVHPHACGERSGLLRSKF